MSKVFNKKKYNIKTKREIDGKIDLYPRYPTVVLKNLNLLVKKR